MAPIQTALDASLPQFRLMKYLFAGSSGLDRSSRNGRYAVDGADVLLALGCGDLFGGSGIHSCWSFFIVIVDLCYRQFSLGK